MTGIKMFLVSLASVLVIAATSNSSANDGNTGTGVELIQLCNQANFDEHKIDWQSCIQYVNGVVDGFLWSGRVFHAALPTTKLKPETAAAINKLSAVFSYNDCAPAVTLDQLGLVVSKYLAGHPERLNQNAEDLVMGAINDAWPCPTTDNKK
jgi:Ssp1 endopeptidase immunity protein Rap1a